MLGTTGIKLEKLMTRQEVTCEYASCCNQWAPGRICRKYHYLGFPEIIWGKVSERLTNILTRS